MEQDINEKPPVVVLEGEPPPLSNEALLPDGAAVIKSVNNASVRKDDASNVDEGQVPRLKKCGDGGGDSSDVSPVDDYLAGDEGDIDDDDDHEHVVITRATSSSGGGREGRAKKRGIVGGETSASSGGSRSSTPKRFTRSSARGSDRGDVKRPRSHSRSKVLTERVMFYEQVWQGAGDDETVSSSPSKLRIPRSRSSRDIESEFSREIDALEQRLERQRERYKSGDVYFEKVTLRHTPSNQSGLLSPPEFLHGSKSETHLNRPSRLTSPVSPSASSFTTRSRTVSYETIENPGGDQEDEEDFPSMAHNKHSTSKSPVYDELLAHSSGGIGGERDISSPTMTKSETKSHVIPGRVSIKYEAVDSPTSSVRSRTPSEDVSEISHSSPSSSRLSNRQAKYEFLGVTADAISRSRTPSGGTSLSSLRSVSPRVGDSSGSLGHHVHHVQEQVHQKQYHGRRLIVTTTTTTSEMKSIRMARSPSSGISSIASPSSETSPRDPLHPSTSYAQPSETDETDTGSSVITRKSVTTTRSYQKSGSSSATATVTPSGSESDDLYSASVASSVGAYRSVSRTGMRSPLPTPAAQEWYTQYQSKVAHAAPHAASPSSVLSGAGAGSGSDSGTPGRFETDVTISAKSRAAYFDSHIAEIKGMSFYEINPR